MDKISKRQWWLYALYSLLFLLIPFFTSPDFSWNFRFINVPGFKESFLSYFLLLVFFFLNSFVLLPKFYFRRKMWQFWGIIVVCFLIYAFIPMQIFPHFVRGSHLAHHFPKAAGRMMPPVMGPPRHHGPIGFIITRYVTQFALVGLFSYSIASNLRWKQTEKARVEAEISYLKAQINPHFLFNSLNSIYALAIEKSDETADAVVRLSGLMRYVLTDASQDMVPLHREIDYITNYISLQETRITDQTKFSFSVNGNPGNKNIAPMLMIPFIENAFKYGINPDEDCELRIDLNITDRELHLFVLNRKVPVRISKEEIGKMGIENAQKRLQALYPGRYILDISDRDQYFSVTLKILL